AGPALLQYAEVIMIPAFARRAVVTFAALTLAAAAVLLAPLHLVQPTAAQSVTTGSLAGQLLVRSESSSDPRFARTTILMVQHDKDGAFGIVINRPVGERTLAQLMELLGDKGTAAEGKVSIFSGGPVQPELGFVVHSADYHGANTIDIDGRVAMTSNR